MKYFSLHHDAPKVSFKEAVIKGLAPDRGLYFPEKITPLDTHFIQNITSYTHEEIAFRVIEQFVGDDIPEQSLKTIIRETLCFKFPVVPLEDNIYTLELFHGPTMAFKDVGARFTARCLEYFICATESPKDITVLVATSGDTGGAVASGFLGAKGIKVVILYPSGKVSAIQEQQLTTFGENITAIEVMGVFDDCQEMVKTAFLDTDLADQQLTSANSINVARWLPQLFYFFFAYRELQHLNKPLVFSTPSGNFGNSCAGILASRLGLPVHHFIAATNVNDTVPRFLHTGEYDPKPSKQTISNAADVGNPSNFIRIQELYQRDINRLKKNFSAFSFTDEATKNAMKALHKKTGYIADPHGALGYLGAKQYLENNDAVCVFLETAHPAKFIEVVEDTLQLKIILPEQIKSVMDKQKKSRVIHTYEELKQWLKGEAGAS